MGIVTLMKVNGEQIEAALACHSLSVSTYGSFEILEKTKHLNIFTGAIKRAAEVANCKGSEMLNY